MMVSCFPSFNNLETEHCADHPQNTALPKPQLGATSRPYTSLDFIRLPADTVRAAEIIQESNRFGNLFSYQAGGLRTDTHWHG